VFDTLSVPRIVPLSGGTAHAISIPGAGLASLLAFDGSSATFQSFSCRGERQLTRVAVDEPRTPGQIGECPVRIPARGLRFSARGDASVRVSCPNGCRADLRLAEQRGLCDFNGTSCRVIATAKLDLPASQRRRRVAFRLTPAGRRLRGRELDVRMTSRGGLGLTFYGEIRSVVLKD
jgi:hypothetical protein